MAIQINFTNLADCGITATSDLGIGIADTIDFDIENYNLVLKDEEEYDRLEGSGYFDEYYPLRNEDDINILERVNYCTVVVARSKNVKSISAQIYTQKSNNGFVTHRALLLCNDEFYERIKHNNFKGNLIQVSIKISKFADSNHYDKVVIADIEQVVLNNNSKNFNANLIEKEIEDIKNHLKNQNCNGSYGQIADICNEFAESLRQVTKIKNKFDLIDEINSLISSFRYTFHSHLNSEDEGFIKDLKQKYDFNLQSYDRNFKIEFAKITDIKDLNKVVKIFNHLWHTRKAEDMFRNGFPFSIDEAESLAYEYLNLKFAKSEIIEKIIIDLLISTSIGERASSLQFHKQISTKTLLSMSMGFYKKENNSNYIDIKIKDIIILSSFSIGSKLIFKVVLGLFEWWFSGLIAGDNETAHIILFGILFATDSILMYFYQKSSVRDLTTDVPNKIDEKNFYIIRDLCNLHKMINVYKSSSFKSQLHKVIGDGAVFPISLHKIIE